MLDLDPWLSPLDGENPSGMSLRDDPRFHEIERLIPPLPRDKDGRPDLKAAVAIDWADVLARAEALRADGRDLRLLVIVARALGNERGFAGLADGLELIARNLESHWDTLHPEIRPASTPKASAQRRLNALLQLQDEVDGLMGEYARKVIFEARGFGTVTGGDLASASLDHHTVVAEGTRGLGERERAERTAKLVAEHDQLVRRVRAAIVARTATDPPEMAALLEAARAAAASFAGVDRAFAARTGIEGEVIELQPMRRYLRQVVATLEQAAQQPDAAAVPPQAAPATQTGAPAPSGAPGRLASRQDVIACLDQIIDFYDRTEPASPVPYLARRMRRMVPMDFLQLMEDLAPSGIKEFRQLAGLTDDRRGSSRPQGEST